MAVTAIVPRMTRRFWETWIQPGSRPLYILLTLLAACNSDDEITVYSEPEPRVATYADGNWTIDIRPGDRFSTSNSIFTLNSDGFPVALRNLGGELLLGTWNGTDWTEESIGNTGATSSDDQLYSGLMKIHTDGSVHAMFVTLSTVLYYLHSTPVGEGPIEWNLLALEDYVNGCYDITVLPDGSPRLLLADTVTNKSVVASVNENGTLYPTDLPAAAAACGSIAASESSTVGVTLWISGNDGLGIVRLYEKPVESAEWSYTDAAVDGYYDANCALCWVPELSYRGDGSPVFVYVANSSGNYVATLASRNAEGGFDSEWLSSAGQSFQLTRLKRATDGSLGTLVIEAAATLRLASTSVEKFGVSTVAIGVEAHTPRLVYSDAGANMSYWDVDGLGAIIADGAGDYSVFLVDASADLGEENGAFIATDAEGHPQIFYNEKHVVE